MRSKELGIEISDVFLALTNIGKSLGTVTSAHLYDSNFISIEGVTREGKEISLSLHIKKEEKKDD